MQRRQIIAAGLCAFLASPALAQQQSDGINPVRPTGSIFTRSYRPAQTAPVRLGNSGRLGTLIRAGKLYLTLQDAVALALENNIDIESQRYDSSSWRLLRAQAGGALPGVPSGSSQVSSVASGQGAQGALAAAGVRLSGGGTGGSGSSNVTISQVGTVAQTYDPAFQESNTFSHKSTPEANAVASGNTLLIQNQRSFTGSWQQGFETGGSLRLSFSEYYLNENAPADVLNPSVAPNASISIQQNFLQGFGISVNTKDIRVAKKNIAISDLNFRSQVERTIANLAGVYFSLVGDYEDFSSKRETLETAQQFLAETRRRVELGASAQLDVTTALNSVATAQQALVNSDAAIKQAELQLKGLISRTGANDPLLREVSIVPLDRIEIGESDEIPAFRDLVTKAVSSRADLAAGRANLEASEISAIGTVNGLLPTGVVIASKTNSGTAGTPNPATAGSRYKADPYFVGGLGNALGQIFGNNFPTQAIGAFVSLQAYDRVAQADYAIDQISLRQQQLSLAKSTNQVQVDIMNATVALRQARARYEAAAQNRILQQKLFDAERRKLAAGESTAYNVTQQQRDLANARSSELASLVAWKNARINLDQNLGATLEVYHVSIAEAQTGKVARASALPPQ